jgi:hypothetical protein
MLPSTVQADDARVHGNSKILVLWAQLSKFSIANREVPGAAPLRPKRTGTSQCWPSLAGGYALLPHTRAQLVSANLRPLLRPGQKTYCAIVKVDNGGEGHFRAKAAIPCLTSFRGINLSLNHPTFASTIDAGM